MRRLTTIILATLAAPAFAAAGFTPAETAAIYKAAGFKLQGTKISDCAAGDPNWPRSTLAIEPADLNGDGKPEAIVSEANIACYGRDEQGFTVVARGPDGTWLKLGGSTGIASPMKARTNGWADIQAGGPGFARMPVMRWTGTAYGDPR